MNTKDFLFGIEPRTATVKIKDQVVNVKEMSIGVKSKYETKLMKFQNGTSDDLEVRSEVIYACVINKDGTQSFTKATDIAQIKKMPSDIVEAIFQKILDISGLNEEVIEEGK